MNKSHTQRLLPLAISTSHTRANSKVPISSKSSCPESPLIFQKRRQNSMQNFFEESKAKDEGLKLTGSKAKLDFYQDYKNINRILERIDSQKTEKTSNVAYLEKLEKKNLRPKSLGLVKKSGNESTIDIHMFSMGDKYAEAFSQGIKHYPHLVSLNINSNRLSDLGNEKILASVDLKQLKILDLSENKVGPKTFEKIIDFMSIYDCHLKHLNLEKTGFHESLVPGLCAVLSFNRRLTKLILADNNLTDKVSKCFKEMLKTNDNLRILDLH